MVARPVVESRRPLDARDLAITFGFELGQLPCRDGVEYGQICVRERENGPGLLVLPSWSSLFSAPGTGKNLRGRVRA
jgi:hypothetical protein